MKDKKRYVYKWKCKECGKEIISFYKMQLFYNASQHLAEHKIRKLILESEIEEYEVGL